eukprot:m.89309 g.89309  ORF g.89309 m.89309 type:complete len:116 (-) comp8406_c0_seq2:83-430(-)
MRSRHFSLSCSRHDRPCALYWWSRCGACAILRGCLTNHGLVENVGGPIHNIKDILGAMALADFAHRGIVTGLAGITVAFTLFNVFASTDLMTQRAKKQQQQQQQAQPPSTPAPAQ